jgi:hypothetical protein
VTNDDGKHRPERAALNRTMKRGVARPRTNAQDTIADGEHVQPGDSVDVDQMRGTREAESHDRHQALAARQDPAIVRRQLRQQPYRLRQSLRPVVGERCRFQRSLLPNQDIDRTPTPRSPI